MSFPAQLSQSTVKNALENLSWSDLKAHLDSVSLDSDVLTRLVGHLRRFDRLISKYPAPPFEQRRDAFLDQLQEYADHQLGHQGSLADLREMFRNIENGYRSILNVLDRCEISSSPPATRASAYISRANVQYQMVAGRLDAAVTRGQILEINSGTLLKDEAGNDYSPDAAITAVVMTLGATLGMEAYRNKWWDKEGRLVLPAIVPATEQDRYRAGSGEALGMCWRRWERAHDRHRFLGAELRELTPAEFPSELPQAVSRVFVSKPDALELLDFIANERLGDRFVQDFLHLTTLTRILEQATGIAVKAELPPTNYISADEAHALHALSTILSFDVIADVEERSGLRLVEWIRGYSLLKALAEERFGSGQADPILIEPVVIADALQRVGLSAEKARAFVDRVTFSKASLDLYDCPLVLTDGGTYVLVAPALLASHVAMLTLSNLGRRNEDLSRKGKAFEAAVADLFRQHGLRCVSFKFRLVREEYEYDAVVPWGDYVFLFECKNHGLSGYEPRQAYYFGLGCEEDLAQVRRLASALEDNPAVVADKLGPEWVGKRIVACVLNCLPFSIPLDDDDVHFTDFSVIRRFFQERYLHTNNLHSLAENTKLLHRTAVHSLWKGDRPTAEDLLRAIRKPIQFEIAQKHTKLHQTAFAVSPDTLVVSYDYMRTNMTVDSFAKAVGANARRVRNDIDGMGDALRKAKKNRSRRALKEEDRMWREARKRNASHTD